MPLPKVPDNKKLLVYGGIAAVAAGLYVLYQRQKSGQTAANAAATTQSTVPAQQDFAGITDALSSISAGMTASNKSITDSLGGLIAASDQHFVDALNAQTTGLGAQLTALGNNAGYADLQAAQSTQTKTITEAIAGGFAGESAAIKGIADAVGAGLSGQSGGFAQGLQAISDAIKTATLGVNSNLVAVRDSVISAVNAGNNQITAQNSSLEQKLEAYMTALFGPITPQIQQISQTVAADAGLLNGLTQSLSAQSEQQYFQIGLKSAAACFYGGGGGEPTGFGLSCINTSLHDYVSRGGAGDSYQSDLQSISASVKSEYASCFRGDHFDLTCVGKLVKQRYS